MALPAGPPTTDPNLATLEEIERRVLWLSVRMIDYANRRGETEIKVGGHQASSASMVSIMTALWFGHIGGEDKVAIKPHASPLYHSIKYLTGELDRSYLTRLRGFGGLQSYPSRTKDPDVADFSTGSVGLGAVAPLFSAATRRFVDAHHGPRPPARFIATVGDAELDEGNVWEAIADPALQGLGNVTLIVDLNRQSLDRVVPGIQSRRLTRFFAEAGWHVIEVKYGAKLLAAFAREGGDALRKHIDDMPNEEYQSLFSVEGPELRTRFLENADPAVERFLSTTDDSELGPLIRNLGGHDIGELLSAYRRADAVTDRPTVVFAYTVKGRGLPNAGDPMNHSALLSENQIDDLRASMDLNADTEWDRLDPETDAGRICAAVGASINNEPTPPRPAIQVPEASGAAQKPVTSSQEAFGRVLVQLGKDPQLASRLVTASPDVAVSTNLGGWINAQGVFSPIETPDYHGTDRLLKWAPGPQGRHIELGISEMNLFLLLGQLGLSHEHHGEMLLPIGTVYDPFVLRGLDALIYSLYNDSKFIIVGTPSGVTLAPEGGAHQSSITPSVGLELPGIVAVEPAYGEAVDWLLSRALRRLADPDGSSCYLRLSTRPIDQAPFAAAKARIGATALRDAVLSGGYRLREPGSGERLIITASGPLMPEVLQAADMLDEEGIGATVIDVTSQDLLFREWHTTMTGAARSATIPVDTSHLATLILPEERTAPILTVHDASPHSMAWLGSVFGQRVLPLGVNRFGESGTIAELYEAMGFLPEQLVNSALVAFER
jgi:pyruvate dehydrogenase E1 component